MAENVAMELPGWRVRGQVSQQMASRRGQKARTNPEAQGSGAQPAASSQGVLMVEPRWK
jgi:hypothetical protein